MKANVMALLEEWTAAAQDALDSTDDFERTLAEKELEIAPEVIEAVERGDTWAALHAALWLGRLNGMRTSRLHVRGARLSGEAGAVGDLALDAWTGRPVREGASAGGRELAADRIRDGYPTNKQLCAAVRGKHDAYPSRSWSWVCEQVGAEHNLSRRTVENRARAADWRQRE